MPDIEGFKSQFRDLSRINRFEVSGTAVPMPRNKLCRSCSSPSLQIIADQYRLRQFTMAINVPYDIAFPDITQTWQIDERGDTYKFFEAWQSYIIGPGRGGNFEFMSEETGSASQAIETGRYVRELFLTQYGYNGANPVLQWRAYVYPTLVGAIGYDYGSYNEVSTFDVTLNVIWWELMGSGSGAGGSGGSGGLGLSVSASIGGTLNIPGIGSISANAGGSFLI